MVKITYKHTELPWEQKWQSLSPIFLWVKSKQNSLTEAHSNRSFGNDILTISSPSGISAERSYNSSLNKPTITTLPSTSRLKFLKRKLHSWTLRFIKATDSLPSQCALDVRTHYKATETFQYKHFSSCHPPGVKRGFIKGEALRLLRTNSTKATFEGKNQTFRITTYREGLSKKSSAENSLRLK